MAVHYLEFERPIADLEAKIEELSKLSESSSAGAFDAEIEALRARAQEMRRDAYANLDAWQKVQVARHPERDREEAAAGCADGGGGHRRGRLGRGARDRLRQPRADPRARRLFGDPARRGQLDPLARGAHA